MEAISYIKASKIMNTILDQPAPMTMRLDVVWQVTSLLNPTAGGRRGNIPLDPPYKKELLANMARVSLRTVSNTRKTKRILVKHGEDPATITSWEAARRRAEALGSL